MRSDYSSTGRVITDFLYFVQGVITFVSVFLSGRVSLEFEIGLLIIWLTSHIVLKYLTEERGVDQFVYCIVQVVFSFALAMTLTFVYFNVYLMVFVFWIQWMDMILFLDKRGCIIMGVLQALVVIFLRLETVLNIMNSIDYITFICFIGTICIATWLSVTLVTLIENQEKRKIEQEQSRASLLRVVELMCDEARAATKSKSQFLSNMSHEIRTPINSVLGMNEMILRESKDEDIIGYAESIENSGRMLLSLINDILDFSKIESGKMELVTVDYDVKRTIDDLVSMITPRTAEKDLVLNVEADSHLPSKLNGDEVRVKQIIINLLTNAVKYTKKGSVTLNMSMEKGILIVKVIDTGMGIREEDQAVLFDAFSRVDVKKNRSIEGTGLGLAITSNFVKMMGGTIGVESEYQKGSTFTVRIPQRVIDSRPIGNYSMSNSVAAKPKVRNYKALFKAPEAKVLITDDNDMNLRVAFNLLKGTEVKTTLAKSGKETLELLKSEKYDVLLLDHMMPEMDGVETLKNIKDRNLAEGMPVIVLTANAISGAKEEYMEAGFSDYLSKPIVGQDLEKLLVKWLPADKVTMNEE